MTTDPIRGVTPSSEFVVVNGLTCRYLRWGDRRDGRAVLLLHGLRSYAHTWDTVASALCDAYQVVAPDFRGRGASAWDPQADYFTATYVRDVESLVDQLGWSRFSIVGHSMGGAVGYAYAAAHTDQVEALVVEDIGPGSSTDTAGARRVLREVADTPVSFASLGEVQDYWRRLRPGTTAAALASRVENTVHRGPDGRWHWTLDRAGIAAARLSGDPAGAIDLWQCVESLTCRTLVVRGADSDFLSVEACCELAERQPLLQWAEVPGAGHYVHDDDPRGYLRLVTEFLDTVAS